MLLRVAITYSLTNSRYEEMIKRQCYRLQKVADFVRGLDCGTRHVWMYASIRTISTLDAWGAFAAMFLQTVLTCQLLEVVS